MPGKRQAGHRQKGAGTVVVSRGEQVRQGLTLKEWQRTPMQLLQQFCQSKKRMNARYVHARAPEGRFRMRCILPDDKSSAKDLAFCPEQDFDTMDDAKHCAALLALRHLEPLRPLERQLPEPYDKLWLALVKEIAPATAAPAGDKKPVGKKAAKKDDAKPPATKVSVTAEKKEETSDADQGINLWGGVAAAEPEPPVETKTKALPMELTSDRKFASRAEMQQARLERVQQRNERQRARENRERANPYKQVLMSSTCREMIEGVLKELGIVGSVNSDAVITAVEDHEELYAKATKELRAIGFQRKHIDGALQACHKESSHSDDEYMTIILDWLCLNVPEGELPKGFNPEGTQLDVVLSSNHSKNKNSRTSSPLGSVLVQRLMKCGYDRLDAAAITSEYMQTHSSQLDVDEDAPSVAVVMGVLQAATKHLLHFLLQIDSVSLDASASTEEDRQQLRDDELLALESIYDDKLQRHELADGGQHLVLHLCDDTVLLDVFLPQGSAYPFELPVVSVSAAADATYPPQLLLHATAQAIRAATGLLGDPMVYELCVAIETAVAETKKPVERIVLMDHSQPKATPSTKPNTVKTNGAQAPPAPTAAKKATNRRKSKPQSNSQPSQEHIAKLSTDLLQRRRTKDSQKDFQSMLQARSRLPAAKEKQTVLQLLASNQVVLVCGATGCGKTTQIPQFILDECIDNGRGGACNIVCTQPRRLAAVGVASRVAQERYEKIADVVGYQIRMDAQKSAATRLLFCTTGVLLRRLLTDQSLAGVSHVIVDEVHERNVDTDFLLSILRDLLPKRRDLKLVLMSATMNAQLFVEYFASAVASRACPILEIPGFTYPVETKFLEEVVDTTQYQIPKHLLKKKQIKADEEKPKRLDELTTTELVALVDDSRIDYDLCVHVVQHIVSQSTKSSGAILVFLPGTAEIKRLLEMLQSALGQKVWVLPLHGSLSGQDQALVFQSPPKGKTKVILSTNVAETSITIDDVTTVIDTGRVKEMAYDPAKKRSELVDGWASRAACDQRRGRAGRVQAGTCYRLFSKHRFEVKMDAQLSAEIHRVSLEQLCLQIKKLGLGSIRGFLAKAIEPPKAQSIDAAIEELVAIAAFKPVTEDDDDNFSQAASATTKQDEEVRLTPLGSHLAMLPLDARIGKFLIFGSILRCVEPVAAIAACIASKSPFVMAMNDAELRAQQETLKKELDGGSKSDHLVLARLVLDKYAPLKGQKNKRGFCRENGLSYETLESILELKTQYLQQLDAVGFYEPSQGDALNANASAPRIVKAALCAGLYANVAQVVYPGQKYVQSAHGALTEDPDAKQLRYFVRTAQPATRATPTTRSHPQERVFLHPSSVNFSQRMYDSPWLLYTELVQTSKLFARESSMVSPYALLLFGGKLSVVHDKHQLVLDNWIRFHAVARIGVLVKAMRRQLDLLLADKLANPSLAVNHSLLVTAITTLLTTEGMN